MCRTCCQWGERLDVGVIIESIHTLTVFSIFFQSALKNNIYFLKWGKRQMGKSQFQGILVPRKWDGILLLKMCIMCVYLNLYSKAIIFSEH